MFLLLFGMLSLLMRNSYRPDQVLFSNDGPLGRLVSECHKLPEAFTGTWEDLNATGYREQGALPNITCGLRLWLGPLKFSKFYAPIALLILGLSAWCFFRQLGLAPLACVLGGLAATLNSCFFSAACWGVAGQTLALAMTFLALAALAKTAAWRGWLRVVLAGMAVGMALNEGADMGAIFSLVVAAFVLYQAWIGRGSRAQNLAVGAGRLGLVIVFSAFLAAYAISALVQTQVSGVKGMEQDYQTREERWNWATQWSLPAREAFSLVVPGLFGYRTDTPYGGNYWGNIGRDIEWTRFLERGRTGQSPRGFVRQTGGGIYTGITVMLIAAWAVVQSFRRRESVFNPRERRWLWFWLGLGLVSLLLGFGRYAPFYQLLYTLPFSSMIRNPVKFLDLVNLAVVVLFAWGVDGLWRKYIATARTSPLDPRAALKARWRAAGMEKSWLAGCLAVLIASLAGWGLYASSRGPLAQYLENNVFTASQADAISRFSIWQVGWFVLFFTLAAGLVALIISGVFSGTRARWGAVLLGLLLTLDLGRANLPWVVYWNYKQKYASNPVIDFLREKPFEQRVIIMPFQGPPQYAQLNKLYRIEWAQHLFQYYDIQASETVQMSRVPEDMAAYHDALFYDGTRPRINRLFRRWELTNTRYQIGVAGLLDEINQKFDPEQHRFRILFRFNIVAHGEPSRPTQIDNLTAELAPDGDYAVFEFSGALPRAKLYSHWQVSHDDHAILEQIGDPSFDPAHNVLVSGGLPAEASSATNASHDAGTVEITGYSSRDVRLKANATAPAVLMLNDRFDPAWHASVDGKPAPMLHCNYLMRGVYLEPGAHTVEFNFQPQAGLLRVSLAAIGIALALFAILMVAEVFQPAPVATPAPARVSAQPVPACPVAPPAPAKVSAGQKRRASKSKA